MELLNKLRRFISSFFIFYVSVTTQEKGIFKNKETKIEFIKDPVDPKELELWEMMKIAAKDNILEKNEFKRSCSNHYSKVLGWFDKVETYEYNKLKEDKKLVLKDSVHLAILLLAGMGE